MLPRFFQIIGGGVTIFALWLFWRDNQQTDKPSELLGQLWYEAAPQSLQLAEAIVERYVDPCGLISFLGCDTFLWHPLIATLLNWPAGLVLGLIGTITMIISSSRIKRGRKSVTSLKKDGR